MELRSLNWKMLISCVQKQEYYDNLVQIALQPKAVLTDVMLETLSIIAYKQPVTRLEIEKIPRCEA